MCVSYIVTLYTTIMVGTPPYQKRGKCGHWMPAFDKHLRCYSCRMHCKGEDPCASGAPLEACSSCSSLSEVEWNHLRTVFQERSAKHASKNVPAGPEPDDDYPEAGEIDDSILDLNSEDSSTEYVSPTGVSAPAGLSPLQPASSTSGSQFIQPSMPPLRSAAFQSFSRLRHQSNQILCRILCSRLLQNHKDWYHLQLHACRCSKHILNNKICK